VSVLLATLHSAFVCFVSSFCPHALLWTLTCPPVTEREGFQVVPLYVETVQLPLFSAVDIVVRVLPKLTFDAFPRVLCVCQSPTNGSFSFLVCCLCLPFTHTTHTNCGVVIHIDSPSLLFWPLSVILFGQRILRAYSSRCLFASRFRSKFPLLRINSLP